MDRERIFLLGPSHHVYLETCALSPFDTYRTPLGDLPLDTAMIEELAKSKQFRTMSAVTDQDEHSLELHLPYIYRVLEDRLPPKSKFPPLVPILVGNTSAKVEQTFGELLAPYLADTGNVFIISSDFAHWGQRFRYTAYLPDLNDVDSITTLSSRTSDVPDNPTIFESIERLDRIIMDRISAGCHKTYLHALNKTGNTVCGRHPIGIILAALEVLVQERRINENETSFRFIRYCRSMDCETVQDSSVSYASAFARVRVGDIDAEVAAEEGQFRGYNADTLLDELTGHKREREDLGGLTSPSGSDASSMSAVRPRELSSDAAMRPTD